MAMSLPESTEKQRFVERMFDGIAPRYDFMNRLMTFGLDRAWRREAVAMLGVSEGDVVVDLGCGTGDLCEDTAVTGATVVGVDVSAGMLGRAMERMPQFTFLRADAAALPLADASCAAAISGFAALRACPRSARPSIAAIAALSSSEVRKSRSSTFLSQRSASSYSAYFFSRSTWSPASSRWHSAIRRIALSIWSLGCWS